VFASESAEYAVTRPLSNQFPDMTYVFDTQFRQLAERAKMNVRPYEATDSRMAKYIDSSVKLYDQYARLVVHSFALQRAGEGRQGDLPSTFSQYQLAAMRLIETFEMEFESSGFTRGCPDFVYTILTFAAVSLLKCTQSQFSHLDPDRSSVLSFARKAADSLARTATTPDHLPATQHAFLTRLIDQRSHDHTLPTLLQPMDFEAFGQSIENDTNKTPWPPGPNALSRQGDQDFGEAGDPYGWLSGQMYSVPEGAIGIGVGSFTQDQDLLFTQDSFW
jgi:hypothetical protein